MQKAQLLTKSSMYIGGEWVESHTREIFQVLNPVTEEVLAEVPKGNLEDLNRAVRAAREALPGWSSLTPGERAGYLYKLADLLEAHQGELAELESRNVGKPIKMTRDGDIPFAVDNLRYFAGMARNLEGKGSTEYTAEYTSWLRREPLGVVGLVSPWNYPFMMAIWKIGPALAMGNTVVLKPASLTPLTTLELARYAEEAGFPKGVLNVITGPGDLLGKGLAEHPDVAMISLTGDTETGKTLMGHASKGLKKVHLELGGKAAFIVYEDADLEAAAEGAVVASFVNSGQDCTAATRIYAHEKIQKPLLAKIVEKARKIRLGDPLDPKTDMGPMVSKAQLERVQGFVERAVKQGARCEVGGKRPESMKKGYYYEPTILSGVRDDWEIAQKEVFGPVVVLMPFSSEEEVIARANGVIYGLASSVWTRDIYKALRTANRLEFGTVWINDHLPLASEMPHGGFKASGFGKDMSAYALEEYTRLKHVMADLSGKARKSWHYTVYGDPEN